MTQKRSSRRSQGLALALCTVDGLKLQGTPKALVFVPCRREKRRALPLQQGAIKLVAQIIGTHMMTAYLCPRHTFNTRNSCLIPTVKCPT